MNELAGSFAGWALFRYDLRQSNLKLLKLISMVVIGLF